jgi:hypothetical protein
MPLGLDGGTRASLSLSTGIQATTKKTALGLRGCCGWNNSRTLNPKITEFSGGLGTSPEVHECTQLDRLTTGVQDGGAEVCGLWYVEVSRWLAPNRNVAALPVALGLLNFVQLLTMLNFILSL